MRYKLFGRSGLRVSELCLGAMTFGRDDGFWQFGSDSAESRKIFDAFTNAGGNFIDTAFVYGNGRSEELVGDFVRADRDHFVLATKYSSSLEGDLSKSGTSRKNMMRCVEQSLRRLKVDCIDLYWLHVWDDTTPIEEIMRGLDDLVSAGKVNYIAISDTPAWQISRGNMLADLRGWAPFIGIQVEYSLLERTAERDLLPMAHALDLGITAWSPLAGGMLTGKFLDGKGEGRGQHQPMTDRQRTVTALVVEIARELGCTPGQAALAFIRQQDRFGTITPIIGARTLPQLQDNLGCLAVTLSPDQWQRLEQATAPDLGFPHAILQAPMIRDMVLGGQSDRFDNHRAP
ncbi:aldo/keto reductase [Denitratisoma oestradiolicum]|uniref:Aldo/keto reductase n=1 Tax=Denitratisoma oestradiolicum TaxID=311182 RepID=A0A6S6XZV8_9PROT|nr:aldo/keto reductase [Denitratisoma oestradiolicum]TWO81279.1 aldo/keto reductase [Denitratisoma oestradiolicum]CAB1368459.1 Aldo/keto reductase [Denitratisoma oestradiolicum]